MEKTERTPDTLRIENKSPSALNDLVLVTDHGYLELGDLDAGKNLMDNRTSALGEIDYHLIYVLDVNRRVSRHMYNGGRPNDERLHHRFEIDDDGNGRWITRNSNGPEGNDIQGQDFYISVSQLKCCGPGLPKVPAELKTNSE
ncbi:MAG: hypothetical protein SGI88_01110 [Candidatus Hydrogenedentes bacterium]|nr:hypothetical protein [Candidatus Hydrogenedentota bacterium]